MAPRNSLKGAKNSGAIQTFERAPISHSTRKIATESAPRQKLRLVRIFWSFVMLAPCKGGHEPQANGGLVFRKSKTPRSRCSLPPLTGGQKTETPSSAFLFAGLEGLERFFVHCVVG